MKVVWSTTQVRENDRLKLDNVISLTLSNHSDEAVIFSNNGVPRTLPPKNKVLNVPQEPFIVELNSNEFDVSLDIKFTGNGNRLLIVDYAKIKENCN